MDTEIANHVFPLIGGALTLAGGVFVFVSGRLKDAKTAHDRQRVVFLTLQWLSFGFNTAGLFVGIYFRAYLSAYTFFAIGTAIQVLLFLRRTGPVSRGELVSLFLVFCIFSVGLASAVAFHFIEAILDLLRR